MDSGRQEPAVWDEKVSLKAKRGRSGASQDTPRESSKETGSTKSKESSRANSKSLESEAESKKQK